MGKPRIWYVIADGGRARIVEKRQDRDFFDTILAVLSVDLHHRGKDIVSDRPGRTFESAMPARHAKEPREDPHQWAKRSFTHEVAQLLNEACKRNEFDGLVLVTPPKALTDLRQALDPITRRKVAAELRKDLTKIPDADLAEHLAGLIRA